MNFSASVRRGLVDMLRFTDVARERTWGRHSRGFWDVPKSRTDAKKARRWIEAHAIARLGDDTKRRRVRSEKAKRNPRLGFAR